MAVWLSLIQDAILIIVFSLFVYAHTHRVVVDHQFSSVPFAIEHLLLIGIYLTRRPSRATSTRWQDWLAAGVGGWITLGMQPQGGAAPAFEYSGIAIQAVGLTMATMCIGFLGRSFGIVAANRGLKTSGPYGFVRHPIYAAHFVTQIGFLVANFHWINVAIIIVAVFAQVMRMNAEERVLESSSEYGDYKGRVRFRLIPGVY